MKIDKRKCPILFEPISFKDLGLSNYITSGNEIPDDIARGNEKVLSECLSNIMYITHPVVEAFDYGDEKTILKLLSLRNEIQTVRRCVIWNEGGGVTTTLFAIEKQDDQTVFSMLCQQTSKQHNPFNYHISGYWNHSDQDCHAFCAAGISSHSIITDVAYKLISCQVPLIIQCEVFLQYAEIETKVLAPNNKESIACRYHNKLNLPITIVDSTWYTTLVKSDSFKVRGHFRLQPFGSTKAQRKLIWINEFMKNGYTREAKKLSTV